MWPNIKLYYYKTGSLSYAPLSKYWHWYSFCSEFTSWGENGSTLITLRQSVRQSVCNTTHSQGSQHEGKSGKVREKFIFLESQGICSIFRLHENFLQLVGHYVWRIWGSSSDVSGFSQSFYTENDRRTWFSSPVILSSDIVPFYYHWTFCLTIQGLVVSHFQNSSDMSDESDGFQEAWNRFLGFRENQWIIFYLCWMVRESQGIWSDSGHRLCIQNLYPSFVSKYVYDESNFHQIFLASLRSASLVSICPTWLPVLSLHRINKQMWVDLH